MKSPLHFSTNAKPMKKTNRLRLAAPAILTASLVLFTPTLQAVDLSWLTQLFSGNATNTGTLDGTAGANGQTGDSGANGTSEAGANGENGIDGTTEPPAPMALQARTASTAAMAARAATDLMVGTAAMAVMAAMAQWEVTGKRAARGGA